MTAVVYQFKSLSYRRVLLLIIRYMRVLFKPLS